MIGRNGPEIARKVLRGSILACPSVPSLVGSSSATAKVFWENVPDKSEPPYITFHHFSGGYEKDRQYWDAVYEVRGHTATMSTAAQLETAIDELDYSWPIIPSELATLNVCGWDTIDAILPMFTRYQVKNNTLFVVSQLYRLRLNLGDLST